MSSINMEKVGIVHWYPELERHKCGYCKTENGAASYGMWAEQLSVEDYQNLIDRGWRRSGMYCYKPVMELTCCPQYTIKCKGLDFQLSKSQKKIIKKFNKFLKDGTTKEQSKISVQMEEEEKLCEARIVPKERPNISIDFHKLKTDVELQEFDTDGGSGSTSKIENVTESSDKVKDGSKSETTKMKKKGDLKDGLGADPNKPLCKKAKTLRLEQRQKKLIEKGMNVEKCSQSEPKSLEQFLNETLPESKHRLQIKLIPTVNFYKESENIKDMEFQLYKKYQTIIHNDPDDKCTLVGFTRFLVSSPLKIKQEHANKNHPSFHKSAELFKKYQMVVHNEPADECGKTQFTEFLIQTPLKTFRMRGKEGAVNFGTFHQQYWLDDKLIAVAVLDILPRCVSSVYFFYDPDLRFLSLGTYGSLREIQFVKSLHLIVPSIEFYYLGYYIHSCPKMRYKGKLSHSFLLCPETYEWFPVEKCIIKLIESKYSRLNDDLDAIDANGCSSADIDRMRVCTSYNFTMFNNYKLKYGEQEVFDNIGKLVGKKCAASLLFVSSHT